jgi:hypothetical protein
MTLVPNSTNPRAKALRWPFAEDYFAPAAGNSIAATPVLHDRSARTAEKPR